MYYKNLNCTIYICTSHSKNLETSYDSCVIYVAGKLTNQFKEKIEQENNFYIIQFVLKLLAKRTESFKDNFDIFRIIFQQ